ncbi:MAG TPA: tetratricopeptide repeat protein [Burkholderiales bacterium]|nr:tetratricopeptide repeat protein [Burkholderiales bacterium]
MNRRSIVVTSLVVWAATAGLQCAFAAEIANREEALTAVQSPDPALRLGGVDGLAQFGQPADAAVLLDELYDDDAEVRLHAQGAVWQVWSRSGDPEVDALLKSGVRQMEEGRMGLAVETFTRITERVPDFAEGWNKRATAYYLMGDYDQSLKDCDEVIKRNPQHFGALSGYGLIYIKRGELERALEYFERALEINPNLESVEQSIELIRYKLGKDGKQQT